MDNHDYVLNRHGSWSSKHEALKWYEAEVDRLRAVVSDAKESEIKIQKLRLALIGLIGVSGKIELEKMEIMIRTIPVPDEDKVAGINAIHALLATIEK